VAGLIADLDSDRFQVREEASRALEQLGDAVLSTCREALKGRPACESRRRLQQIVERQEQDRLSPSAESLRARRALEVLELTGTPEAHRLMEALAGGARDARLTRDARAALDRMARCRADGP
jgi:hypothetical protein